MKIGTGNAGGVSPSAVYSFSALPSYAISYVYEPVEAYEDLPVGVLTDSICQTTSDSIFWQFDGAGWIELGGAGALGEATVWPSALNWAALPTEDLRQGDRSYVEGLGQPSSYGIAQYNGADWELAQGFFLSEADLNEFTLPIYLGAFAYVLGGEDFQDGAGRFYYYDGDNWIRTPGNTKYIYPQVATVAEVLDIVSPKDGDKVFVVNTGFFSSGYAVYVAASSMWKLDQGWFPTIANMESFSTDPDTVKDGAIVSIGGIGSAYPHYVYVAATPAWVRTPADSKYIWPQVNLWADLLSPTLARPYAVNNDEVHVHSLITSHSSATAQLHGETWKLVEGRWTSVSDMNNWLNVPLGQLIHDNARALVDPTHAYGANATAYFYNGTAWVPAPTDSPTTFTLSSLQDFSGSGLKEGDYGIHTPSGGAPILVRYKAACPITATIGGTVQMWLPPVVYAGTPQIRAFIVGTEANDTAIGNKGWTVARVDTGTVGTVGGYMRLNGPSTTAPTGSSGTLTGPSFTGANKFYLVGEFRGTASGSDPYAGIFGNASVSIPVQYALGTGNSSTTIRQKTMPSNAWANADTLSQIQSGGQAWPPTIPLVLQALSGAVISDLVETRFDGKLYTSFRRNFDSAVDASTYSLLLIANGGGSSTTSTLEFRNLYFLTY